VTHSICTLEFETNRPLYDWVVENTPNRCRPHQYEFARLNLDYTVMSKRKLLSLVREGRVSGWDDPRMPTIAGLRRRGVTPEAIRAFAEMIGVAKTESRVDIGKLEYAIREDLNAKAPRVLAVLRPLRVTITNFPAGEVEWIDAPFFPRDVGREGSRRVPFAREILIERDDFTEEPPAGYRRLAPGRAVRLRHAYVIRCDEVVRNDAGEVVELRCSYDAASRTGGEARGVAGTIHWVSAAHALPCEVRLYDRLFRVPDPDAAAAESGEDFTAFLNPESLVVAPEARIEPAVQDEPPGSRYQFERLGFFIRDPEDANGRPVFNRTVTLRDSWARQPDVEAAPVRVRAERKVAELSPEEQRRLRQAAAPPRSAELEARRRRYQAELGLPEEDAELITREEAWTDLFEAALGAGATPAGIANWVINELPREIGARTLENLPFGGTDLGRLVGLVEDGTLSSSAAREVLAEMVTGGEKPDVIVERRGLRQISDEAALVPIVDQVLGANAAKAAEYRAGRTGLIGFFVGQVMRQTGGKANPELVRRLLEERLAQP
jgi:glutaminyl-tRNA synthetase